MKTPATYGTRCDSSPRFEGCNLSGTGEGLSEEAVAASTQALATAVLDQGGISEDASLMRAAAQMYACAACIGTNSAATQLTQSVCKDMAQTPVPARSLPLQLSPFVLFSCG